MFLYKYDMKETSKIKMGPVWDFDSAFDREGKWAAIHQGAAFCFKDLLKRKEFCEIYINGWEDIAPNIIGVIEEDIDNCMQSYGEELQRSWDLQAKRWGNVPVSVKEVAENTMKWFVARSEWLNQQIDML